MRIALPTVLCGGRVVVERLHALVDEVRLCMPSGVIHYVKRNKDEEWNEFVNRLTKFAEDKLNTEWR